MTLRDEIFEQPNVLARLLEKQKSSIQKIAREIKKFDPVHAFIAARGTSDNAARYANYLFGAHNQLPVTLATPSLFTIYNQPPRLRQALVVVISQSGQSPDVVSVLEEGRRQNSPTLTITNSPSSPAAQAADFVIDLQAGEERAVAATKTYTAELLVLAMLSTALAENEGGWDDLERVPGWARATLNSLREKEIAERYRYLAHCVVIGRGYNYATAYEWALKLKELTYVIAEPYSSADFQHGPIAMVEPGFAVMAVAPSGKVHADTQALLANLRKEHRAELIVVSDQQDALGLAQTPLPLPAGIPEWVSPLVSILPGQAFALSLTKVKGLDTEHPRTIHKVTETL